MSKLVPLFAFIGDVIGLLLGVAGFLLGVFVVAVPAVPLIIFPCVDFLSGKGFMVSDRWLEMTAAVIIGAVIAAGGVFLYRPCYQHINNRLGFGSPRVITTE